MHRKRSTLSPASTRKAPILGSRRTQTANDQWRCRSGTARGSHASAKRVSCWSKGALPLLATDNSTVFQQKNQRWRLCLCPAPPPLTNPSTSFTMARFGVADVPVVGVLALIASSPTSMEMHGRVGCFGFPDSSVLSSLVVRMEGKEEWGGSGMR